MMIVTMTAQLDVKDVIKSVLVTEVVDADLPLNVKEMHAMQMSAATQHFARFIDSGEPHVHYQNYLLLNYRHIA